ncbi:hypothetical protein IQ03_03501 [Gemmobacter caeni]|uniref:Uncharacterized protein n=1 Tax=Gemmobacter caeni TaxID=589035 RepID=A0A2T6AT61_9RHOB|nr:hypothetical protein [Gemmobacter caeni]PTX47002.1 hypothetical protein C8N34_11422 [Gemmobacter caeni]TWI96141.1 hypothetical protein IQ03_03501 [Gemmobacter caeni]
MAVILQEGWKTYADRTEVGFGWPLRATSVASSVFTDISGRRTYDMYGAKVAKTIAPTRRVCAHFVLDLTAGTIGSTTTLFQLGLNPANIAASAYETTAGDRFIVEGRGTTIRVVRNAFGADGSVQSGSQTVATATHTMSAGASYRIEVLADVTAETGTAEVLINGVSVLSAEFSRTIGTYPCDAPFGIASLYAQGVTGARGRLSNLVLYTDDATTTWPVGPLNISYLPAAPNAGETINFPPLLTDPEIPITDATGKTWSLGDISGVSAASIKAVIGSVRMSSPDAVVPASADVVFRNGAAVLASSTHVVQPGTPVYDRHTTIPVTDPGVLNAMTMTVRKTP